MIKIINESLLNILKGKQKSLTWPSEAFEVDDLVEVGTFKDDEVQAKIRIIDKIEHNSFFCEYKIILEWSKEGEELLLRRLRKLGYIE